MEINFGFGPGFITPEEIEAQRAAQEAQIRQMIDDKRCEFCANTFLIDDQITICNFSGECVDGQNGTNCEHWEVLNVGI